MLTYYITKVKLSKPWNSHCAILWTEVQNFSKFTNFSIVFFFSFKIQLKIPRCISLLLDVLSCLPSITVPQSFLAFMILALLKSTDWLSCRLSLNLDLCQEWICFLINVYRQCLKASHAYLDPLVKLTSVKFFHCKIIFSFVVDKYLGEMFWDCGNRDSLQTLTKKKHLQCFFTAVFAYWWS